MKNSRSVKRTFVGRKPFSRVESDVFRQEVISHTHVTMPMSGQLITTIPLQWDEVSPGQHTGILDHGETWPPAYLPSCVAPPPPCEETRGLVTIYQYHPPHPLGAAWVSLKMILTMQTTFKPLINRIRNL